MKHSINLCLFFREDKDKTIITYEDYSGMFISADTVSNKKKFTTFNSYVVRAWQ